MSDLPTCPRCGRGAVDVATLGDRHPQPLAACTCVDELERSAEWLAAGDVDVDHLLAEHRAAVEVLRAYRRRTLELVAERDRLQRDLDAARRRELEALDVIRQAGIDHGHDVARLLELEDALEQLEVQRAPRWVVGFDPGAAADRAHLQRLIRDAAGRLIVMPDDGGA